MISHNSTIRVKASRRIVHRTHGRAHGPIVRLMSPSDLGALLKPFVFLDHGSAVVPMAGMMGWHPHSGIATVSVMLDGSMAYEETTGRRGVVSAGGVEWMRAGAGVWHNGGPAAPGPMKGFQLWVALPPDMELLPAASQYLAPEEVPSNGPARVVLGVYGAARSPIDAPPGINYMVVRLRAGERWTYEVPAGHKVAWVAVHEGSLHALDSPDAVVTGELAAFEPSESAIELMAEEDSSFVLGSAVPHAYPLQCGTYSVHTSARALAQGEAEIERLGRLLRKRD